MSRGSMACKGLRVFAMIAYVLALLLMSGLLIKLAPVIKLESIPCHSKASLPQAAGEMQKMQSAATQQVALQHISSRQSVQDLRVFVGVLSSTGSLVQRNAIRRTWASDKRLARVMFCCPQAQVSNYCMTL
jgi:hypothetical protein